MCTSLKHFIREIWRYLSAKMIGNLPLSRQKNIPMVLGTITNGIVYELLAKSDEEQLSLTVLNSKLDSFLLTHRS